MDHVLCRRTQLCYPLPRIYRKQIFASLEELPHRRFGHNWHRVSVWLCLQPGSRLERLGLFSLSLSFNGTSLPVLYAALVRAVSTYSMAFQRIKEKALSQIPVKQPRGLSLWRQKLRCILGQFPLLLESVALPASMIPSHFPRDITRPVR